MLSNILLNLKKVVLVFCFTVLGNSVHAQFNRYGMRLIGDNSSFQLLNQIEIDEILTDSLNLPKDLYQLWKGYAPKLIQAEDYTNCTTKAYVFKEYPAKGYSLSLEVDIPKETTNKWHPFVIWVHGGGWVNGGAGSFKNQSQYLASRGIAGVRITYSLQKQGGRFEMGIQELKSAFQFVKDHAEEWGLDIQKYGWAGGSAGTPLSSLVAIKDSSFECKLFVGYNGLYDFENNRQGKFCGGKEIKSTYLENTNDWHSISAINHIPDMAENIPAVILFHGTGDTTISYKQSEALCDAILQQNGKAMLHFYPYYAHAFFNQNRSDVYEDITIKTYKFAESVFNTVSTN